MDARAPEPRASEPRAPEPRSIRLARYEKRQGEWMERMRGNLMLVATVIATMNFQIAMNPPGGVLQENKNNLPDCSLPNNQACTIGTSVFAHHEGQIHKFHFLLIMCTISFSASLSIILLLISGLPLRNRVAMWTLMIAMSISVYCTVAAYLISISMVVDPPDTTVNNIIWSCAVYWIGLGAVISLILFIRFLFCLIRRLVIALCNGICHFFKLMGKLCGCKGHASHPPTAIRTTEMSSHV